LGDSDGDEVVEVRHLRMRKEIKRMEMRMGK
jgi:hypothetical protein